MEWSCHLPQKTPPRVPCLHLDGSVTVSSFVRPQNGEFTAAITANEASEQWSRSPPRRGQREARSSQIPLCCKTEKKGEDLNLRNQQRKTRGREGCENNWRNQRETDAFLTFLSIAGTATHHILEIQPVLKTETKPGPQVTIS